MRIEIKNSIQASAAGFYGLIAAGFLGHTSSAPNLLNKYSFKYAFVLLCLFICIPFVYSCVGYLLSEHRYSLFNKYRLTVGSREKIAALLTLVFVLNLAAGFVMSNTTEHQLKSFHPSLMVQPSPDLDGINHWRFRGEEIEMQKPPGVFRIFFLGGSTVLCDDTPFEKTHVRLVEKTLRAKFPQQKIEIQNAGVPWYSSQESMVRLLTYVRDFDPDLIILWHGINDAYRSFGLGESILGRDFKNDYSHFVTPLEGMLKSYRQATRTALTTFISQTFKYFWLSDFKKHGTSKKKYASVEVPISEMKSIHTFNRNMATIVEFAKAHNIEILLASQAHLYRDEMSPEEEERLMFIDSLFTQGKNRPTTGSMVRIMGLYNDASRVIALTHGVPFLDLERAIPKDWKYFSDEVHYTEAGNILVADVIAERIIELGVLDKRQAPGAARGRIRSLKEGEDV